MLASDAPTGLKTHFEGSAGFTSWKEFSIIWDVIDVTPLVTRRLQNNPEVVWQAHIEKTAKVLVMHKGKPVRVGDAAQIDGR